MNTTKGIFSHATDEWETPQDFFDELNRIYHFDLDVCATEQNAKCDRFFNSEQDGLKKSWGGGDDVVQSSLLKHHRVVQESNRGTAERNHDRHACTGTNRHEMVSPIRLAETGCINSSRAWTAPVWRVQPERTVPKYGYSV